MFCKSLQLFQFRVSPPVLLEQNPGGTVIGQWLNTSSHGRILQLSHALSSVAREGDYTLSVYTNKNKPTVVNTFHVKKYGTSNNLGFFYVNKK